jgi:hypothetical protein
VVVGVVFRVFCQQNGTWCAVCRVGATDMHHPCFPVATCLMCMDMGGGAGTMPVARLGGCGLSVCELPHRSSAREVGGTTSRCVGGGYGRLPAFSPYFLISICIVSMCMCSGGNLMRWMRWGEVLTWCWGSFSVAFLCGARVRCPVAAVWALDAHRLCFPIATYSLCMGMGDGCYVTPAAGSGGCGLGVCGGGWSWIWEGQWRGLVRGVVEGTGAIHPYLPPSRTCMSVFELAVGLVGPIVTLYLVVSVSQGSPTALKSCVWVASAPYPRS